ncbi:MAG: hypothetical protein A3B68_09605 [Candidatus Melainabacteria bacterium RIFCSPHIGHO2_02_FULL_34_12]|nr:MAG: hypothetical protein A3B68_09605 [Candidatus Melainabacteria bacterium RIFCSPHIGHO2_02_FULL_34_12]
MDVFLDTNALWDDLLLEKDYFNLLINYVQKSKSKIIIPQVVVSELEWEYQKKVTMHLANLKKATGFFRESGVEIKLEHIAPEKLLNIYKDRLSYKFNIEYKKYIEILPPKPEYIEQLSHRSIRSIQPFISSEKSKDRGFRDSLIWLTLIDRMKGSKLPCALISNDGTAFGKSGKLMPELEKEAKENDFELLYYNQLSNFVEEKSDLLEYLDEQFIKSHLKNEEIIQLVYKVANELPQDEILKQYTLKNDGTDIAEGIQEIKIGGVTFAECRKYEDDKGITRILTTYLVNLRPLIFKWSLPDKTSKIVRDFCQDVYLKISSRLTTDDKLIDHNLEEHIFIDVVNIKNK